MNVLVIGGGSIGQRHMRNLKAVPGLTVEACTQNAEIWSLLGFHAHKALSVAWAGRPAAAVVANVTNERVTAAMVAVEHDCHLLIEKPLSHNLGGADALKRVAEHRKLVVMVGCNMRFHPGLQAIKCALDKKLIGPALSVEAHFYN